MVPLSVACLAPFTQPPVLQLGYSVAASGQSASVTLDLPVVATKFCQPVDVPQDVFATRWAQVCVCLRVGGEGGSRWVGVLGVWWGYEGVPGHACQARAEPGDGAQFVPK